MSIALGGYSEPNDDETWSGIQQSPQDQLRSAGVSVTSVWGFIKTGETGTNGQRESGDGTTKGVAFWVLMCDRAFWG